MKSIIFCETYAKKILQWCLLQVGTVPSNGKGNTHRHKDTSKKANKSTNQPINHSTNQPTSRQTGRRTNNQQRTNKHTSLERNAAYKTFFVVTVSVYLFASLCVSLLACLSLCYWTAELHNEHVSVYRHFRWQLVIRMTSCKDIQ